MSTLSLRAEWVVLSACNTAAGDGSPSAQGLSGLARAFFYADAESLLVSHWCAQDDAAIRLTTTTFSELASHPAIGKAEALRRATLALIDDKAKSAYGPSVVLGPLRAR